MDRKFTATVVRATGSWYDVLHDGETVRCRIRGRLRLKGVRSTNPVVVGDEVACEADEGGDYVIADILPRRNYVIRRASNLSKESHIIAANVDQALLMASLRSPETPTEFVDRFLVTCEAYKVPVTILLSKLDLQDAEAVAEFRAVYEGAGYRVLEVSVREGRGVEEVRELLAGRTTLVSGNSGVGKSTLIQAIDPSLDIRTGEIEVHPLVHGGVRSGHAGQIVLANGHIADAVLGKNGEVALTVGTHIRIRGSQLFGTLSSGGVVGGIAQLHAVQTGLCTGLVDELQEILLVHLILCADVGVFFVDVRRNRHSVLCSARSQRLERRCAAKHHSQRHSSCRDLLNSTHFEFHKTSS